MNMAVTTDSDTRIIDLAELRGGDEFPAYVAINSQRQGNPFLLSPTAMRWNERVILVRLDACRDFWLQQKKKLRCKLTGLFEPLLRHHYGEEFAAVFGDHPWQCLWYLDYQSDNRSDGVFLLQSRLDRNIFKSLGWDRWFAIQQDLARHLQAIDTPGFRQQDFSARQARLRRFIQRIGVSTPSEMQSAHVNAVSRRFGKWLGLIWRWSFTGSSDLQGFPWVQLRQPGLPAVERELDYPLNQWSYIEVLLREDMSRLCEQFQRHDSEHVNRMRWEITLFNYRRLGVELSFRHPYSLHRDQPEFETALYQARYVYEDVMRKLKTRDEDLDLPESMPFIGWRIEVVERIMLAPALWELFERECDRVDYRQIMSLQNKLPIAFECYRSRASFIPEDSFAHEPLGAIEARDCDHQPWICGAANKPLFYYPAALPIDAPCRLRKLFLERNSNPWWLSDDALQTIRDYFVLQDERGRSSWAYRNQDGAWFKQGEYN
jgi:hypothetical protein